MALPALGTQYPVFSATAAPKLMDDGKVHGVEHLINPLTLQHEHAATTAVLPAVSTPPPFQVRYASALAPQMCISMQIKFTHANANACACVSLTQGRPITPVYAMAHNVPRLPTGLYGAGYVPLTAHTANTAALAALQKNAAVAAAAYGTYGYVPQAFPTATFQMPLHDVYQTY